MAEPLSCRESPFAAYLQDLGSPEASLLDASPPSPPAVPRSGAEPYEQVKFTLATSALLSATVEDALELYPTLSTLVQQDTIARTANARHGGAAQGQRAKVTLWPDAWDTVGQTWRDRDTLSNLREALSECVQRLQRLSIADSPGRIAQPLNAAVQAPSSQTRRHDTVEVELLTKVESWVRNAQMLDWTIALAMARLDRRGYVPSSPACLEHVRAH
ncbi:uncharacterized protein JCM15063_004249 [Sporobolomyces koalae]|uniref:uncharacterized protein n=1 Tax=Sporobolomyces koalae TaxID=500713 RepID=UPI00317EA81B